MESEPDAWRILSLAVGQSTGIALDFFDDHDPVVKVTSLRPIFLADVGHQGMPSERVHRTDGSRRVAEPEIPNARTSYDDPVLWQHRAR